MLNNKTTVGPQHALEIQSGETNRPPERQASMRQNCSERTETYIASQLVPIIISLCDPVI